MPRLPLWVYLDWPRLVFRGPMIACLRYVGRFLRKLYSNILFPCKVTRPAWYRTHRDLSFWSWLGFLFRDYNDGYTYRKRPWSTPQHILVSKPRKMVSKVDAHLLFCYLSGADEETDDDCVHDLLTEYSVTSTQAMLVIWVYWVIFLDLKRQSSNWNHTGLSRFRFSLREPWYRWWFPRRWRRWWRGSSSVRRFYASSIFSAFNIFYTIPSFDILTTVVKNKVTAQVSQGCSGIDGQAAGTFRRSLRRHNHNVKKRQVPARMIRRRRFA